jgi:2-polyprenyl-6-methoxyphenol hydroxylase-like FAD-dependent oxidoreductase
MPIKNTHVAVVGGGIGGLAAALLLARAGAHITLLERVREPREVGAGLLLQPNGLAVLDGLSLTANLHTHGHRLTETVVRTAAGDRIVNATVPHFAPGLDHVLAVRRSRLLADLLHAAHATPTINLHFGCDVNAAHGDGTVEYHTPDNGRQTMRADLVVGADGAHSVIRRCGAAAGEWRADRRAGHRWGGPKQPILSPSRARTCRPQDATRLWPSLLAGPASPGSPALGVDGEQVTNVVGPNEQDRLAA